MNLCDCELGSVGEGSKGKGGPFLGVFKWFGRVKGN